jgi:uncharacterized protein (TIGR03790 family)
MKTVAFLAAWTIGWAATTVARGELKPEEVAVLAVASSPTSIELAEYYAKARGIPASQICRLDVKPGDDLGRADWEQKVRPQVRSWLAGHGLEAKIRCLVTVWDMPLRIGGRAGDAPVVVQQKEFLSQGRRQRQDRLALLLASLDALASEEKPAPRAALDPHWPAPRLAAELQAALRAAQGRVQKLEPPKKQAAGAELEKALIAGAGIAAYLNAVAQQPSGSLPAEAVRQIELTKATFRGLQQGLAAIESLPDAAMRDAQLLRLLEQVGGLIGTIAWIDGQLDALAKNETAASFDSELALVYWPDYPLLRWYPNPLYYGSGDAPANWPTLMVARLAAPKPELVKRLIDASLATEKSGLSGKVYIDARGLDYHPGRDAHDSYAQYDQSLRDLAERLGKHTKLEVVLDNKNELFQAGQCPDAALYCGWYSLAHYIDAFTWRPGAVAYHIASSEAVELLKPDSPLWCPAMLQRGVAATLGPTFEPYLMAFPLPDDFFSLLLTGRLTLAETYYRTCPFLSWAMVLVGDPLYNPYKLHPQLEPTALPERLQKSQGKTPGS